MFNTVFAAFPPDEEPVISTDNTTDYYDPADYFTITASSNSS